MKLVHAEGNLNPGKLLYYTLLPLLPPGFLVVSCGTGVTSSIRPILKPALAKALIAA